MSADEELPLAAPTGAGARRIGRPPVLDSDVTRRVVEVVRAGNYAEVAAASVGISGSTFRAWLREGARIRRVLEPLDEEAYDAAVDDLTEHQLQQAEFSAAVEKAMADSEVIDVLNVRKAAADHWQAAMTRLERRHPQRWGRREAVEVTGQLDGVHVAAASPEAAIDASRALQDARASALACDLLEQLAGETASDPGGNIPGGSSVDEEGPE